MKIYNIRKKDFRGETRVVMTDAEWCGIIMVKDARDGLETTIDTAEWTVLKKMESAGPAYESLNTRMDTAGNLNPGRRFENVLND